MQYFVCLILKSEFWKTHAALSAQSLDSSRGEVNLGKTGKADGDIAQNTVHAAIDQKLLFE